MAKKKSYPLSFAEIKEKKQHNPYEQAKSISSDGNFWDKEHKQLYDEIYSGMKVFQHKYVKWSDISNLENGAFNLSIKYDNLGLKDLVSYKSTWVWYEDIVRKFYGTLFVNSDRTEMKFMIGSRCCFATKKDLEEALDIKPRDDSIVLHSLPEWNENDTDACSLYVVPNINTKEVRHLKPEVDLIQKINRWTLLPRSGNRGNCSDMLLKVAHAIYHEKHFDVAHFLLSEMCNAIETPNHPLPYAPHIFCLLRRLKLIPKKIKGQECFLKKYSPQLLMEQLITLDSVVASIAQLSEQMEEFQEEVVKRFETIEKRLENVETYQEEVVKECKTMEKRFSGLSYKRRRAHTEGGDGSCAAADGTTEKHFSGPSYKRRSAHTEGGDGSCAAADP